MKVVIQSFSENPLLPKNEVFEVELHETLGSGKSGWRRLASMKSAKVEPEAIESLPILHGGFVDSHLHLSWMGEHLASLQARDYKNAEDFFLQAEKRIKTSPAEEIHTFFSWDESHWNLTAGEVADHSKRLLPSDRRWFLFRICGHKALLSPAAYREIFASVSEVAQWVDGEDVFKAYAWLEKSRAWKISTYIQRAQEELLGVGINAVSDMALDASKIQGLLSLAKSGRLKLDVAGVLLAGAAPEIESAGPKIYQASGESEFLGRAPVVTCRHWKKFLDGSLGARTAWLSEPYADDPENYGRDLGEIRALIGEIEEALGKGFHLSFHAIGDAAIDRILEMEEMLQSLLSNRRRMRGIEGLPPIWHRIEHGQILRDDQISRLSESSNWLLCAQPFHREMDESFIVGRLGEKRLHNQAYRLQSLLTAGIPVLMGSDMPIGCLEPLKTVKALLNHPNLNERPSWTQAMWLFTRGNRHFLGLPDREVRTGGLFWLSENPLA